MTKAFLVLGLFFVLGFAGICGSSSKGSGGVLSKGISPASPTPYYGPKGMTPLTPTVEPEPTVDEGENLAENLTNGNQPCEGGVTRETGKNADEAITNYACLQYNWDLGFADLRVFKEWGLIKFSGTMIRNSCSDCPRIYKINGTLTKNGADEWQVDEPPGLQFEETSVSIEAANSRRREAIRKEAQRTINQVKINFLSKVGVIIEDKGYIKALAEFEEPAGVFTDVEIQVQIASGRVYTFYKVNPFTVKDSGVVLEENTLYFNSGPNYNQIVGQLGEVTLISYRVGLNGVYTDWVKVN